MIGIHGSGRDGDGRRKYILLLFTSSYFSLFLSFSPSFSFFLLLLRLFFSTNFLLVLKNTSKF